MKESGIRVSLTNQVRGRKEKHGIRQAFLVSVFGWLYLLMGECGVLFAITDAFQIDIENSTIFLLALAVSTVSALLLGGRKWRRPGLAVLFAGTVVCAVLCRKQIAVGLSYIWECIGLRFDRYFLEFTGELAESAGPQEIMLAFLVIGLVLALLLGTFIFVLRRTGAPLLLFLLTDLMILIVGMMPSMESVLLQVFCLIGAGVLSSCSNKQPVFSMATRVESGRILQQKMQLQMSVTMMLLGAGILFILLTAVLPPVYGKVEEYRAVTDEWKHKIQDFTINDWDGFDFSLTNRGSMGISGGNLGNYKTISARRQTDLSITSDVDYNGTVFIKGFSAGLYGGDRWEQAALQEWAETYYGSGTWTVAGEDYIAPEYAILSLMEDTEPEHISVSYGTQIRLEHASDEYSYLPGFAQASRFGSTMAPYGWAEGIGSNASYVTAYADVSWLLEQFGTIGKRVTDQPSRMRLDNGTKQITVDYEQFVSDNYLQIPSQVLDRVQTDWYQYLTASSQNTHTYRGIVRSVISYLNERAEYTLTPGKTPKGEDFIDYFIFTQKKGYCVHFASTAAMLFRMCGIPARYTEGYSIDGVQKGVTVLVEDSKAHAWCEIYINGFGWVPIDVTPGSRGTDELLSESGNGNSETQESELESQSTQEQSELTSEQSEGETTSAEYESSQDETEGDKASETVTVSGEGTETVYEEIQPSGDGSGETIAGEDGSQSVGGSGRIGTQRLRIVLTVLAVIAFLLLFRIAVRRRSNYLMARRQSRMQQRSCRLGILAAYQYTVKLTGEAGRRVAVDTEEEAFQKMYPSLSSELFLQWKHIVEEAYFSRHEMSSEDRELALEFYSRLFEETLLYEKDGVKHAAAGTVKWRRFCRRYGSCYPQLRQRKQ